MVISGINPALAGLGAIQKKIEANANNVANLNTDGFKKDRVTLSEQATGMGPVARTEKVETPGPMVYEQTPAGEELVEKSNVDLAEELPSLALNRRFFEANLKTIQVADEMLGSLLDIKS